MKILIAGQYHHKNHFFLEKAVILLGWDKVGNIEEADIIFSPNKYFDISKYPTKKFILGPHFSVFPDGIVRQLNNIHKNAIYIQPSQPSVNTWVNEFKFENVPVKSFAFGVDTDRFNSNINKNMRDKIFVYFKNRKNEELEHVKKLLDKNGYKYTIFSYKNKYSEDNYLQYLKDSKFGIWVGRHESQGFALEEALSCNVPLLVWNVKMRYQEVGYENTYKNVKTPVTTIPYWNDKCGEYFYEMSELEGTFTKFLNNLDNYNPRDYVVNNLSISKRTDALKELIDSSFP